MIYYGFCGTFLKSLQEFISIMFAIFGILKLSVVKKYAELQFEIVVVVDFIIAIKVWRS
jgi:hypothetical protein